MLHIALAISCDETKKQVSNLWKKTKKKNIGNDGQTGWYFHSQEQQQRLFSVQQLARVQLNTAECCSLWGRWCPHSVGVKGSWNYLLALGLSNHIPCFVFLFRILASLELWCLHVVQFQQFPKLKLKLYNCDWCVPPERPRKSDKQHQQT